MDNLQEFKGRIEEKLAAVKEKRKHQHRRANERGMAAAERHRHFTEKGSRLMSEIIRPRLQELASYFDDAEMLDDAELHSGIHFRYTVGLPVTMKLVVNVNCDTPIEKVVVDCNLEVSPVTVPFNGHQEISFPLNAVDKPCLTAWLDDRLCEFVDIYLRIETDNGYREESMAIDPVCGMRVVMEFAAAKTDYQGATYYFCTDECCRKFVEAPRSYLLKPASVSSVEVD